MRCVLLSASAALAIGACAASDAEIQAAKTAVYHGNSGQLLQLAEQGAADENYRIAGVDDANLTFETTGRFYSATGMLESPGAGGYVKVDNHSVKVSFIVALAPAGPSMYEVTVTPRTWQYLSGSPQMRELKPDDPYLPSWVLGRADHLEVAIHDRLQSLEIAAPGQRPGPR